MGLSRTELLLSTLITRRVASGDQLFRLVYQPHQIAHETLLQDLAYLEQQRDISTVLLSEKTFYVPGLTAGLKLKRKVEHPGSAYKVALFAFFSEMAAQVISQGQRWIEYPRKQLKTKIPRDVRAYYTETGQLRFIAVDPSLQIATQLAQQGELLILAFHRQDCFQWQIDNTQVLAAQQLL